MSSHGYVELYSCNQPGAKANAARDLERLHRSALTLRRVLVSRVTQSQKKCGERGLGKMAPVFFESRERVTGTGGRASVVLAHRLGTPLDLWRIATRRKRAETQPRV